MSAFAPCTRNEYVVASVGTPRRGRLLSIMHVPVDNSSSQEQCETSCWWNSAGLVSLDCCDACVRWVHSHDSATARAASGPRWSRTASAFLHRCVERSPRQQQVSRYTMVWGFNGEASGRGNETNRNHPLGLNTRFVLNTSNSRWVGECRIHSEVNAQRIVHAAVKSSNGK